MEEYVSNLYHVNIDDILEESGVPFAIINKSINTELRNCNLHLLNLITFNTIKIVVPVACNEEYLFTNDNVKDIVYKFRKLNINAVSIRNEILNMIASSKIINTSD